MTLNMLPQDYSSKAVAKRGAERAGLTNYRIEQNKVGRWVVINDTAPLEPGVHNVEITKVKVDKKTGAVKTGLKLVDVPAAHQPELSAETKAAAEKTIEMAKEDLAKLAATLPPRVVSTPEEIAARRAERVARIEADKANAPEKIKVPSYKELHRIAPSKSAVVKPVDMIREFLDANYATMSRKECIAALVAKGINMTTCRTQYQLYRKKLGAGAGAGAGGLTE